MATVQKLDVYYWAPLPKIICKPSMRILPLADVNNRRRSWRRSDYFYPEMIPEPDYSDSNEEDEEKKGEDENKNVLNEIAEENLVVEEITAKEDTKTLPRRHINESSESFGEFRRNQTAPVGRAKPPINTKEPCLSQLSEEGLVVPKKPNNPYLESKDRQKLCKELKFSQKYGNGGFNSKSELQKTMEKFQEDKFRKNQEVSRKSSLDRILEQQAKKIEMQEKESRPRRPDWIDRLQEQPDAWIKDSRTPEFFRVHARVMANQSSTSSGSSSESLIDEDARSKSSGSPKTSTKYNLDDNEEESGKKDQQKPSS